VTSAFSVQDFIRATLHPFGMPLPRIQMRVLRGLRRLYDQKGPEWTTISEVSDFVRLNPDECGRALFLLDQAKLVEWSFVSADPWYGDSAGIITQQGYQTAYNRSWSVKAAALVSVAGSSASSTIVSIVASSVLPDLTIGVSTFVGGLLGGTFFGLLAGTKLLSSQ